MMRDADGKLISVTMYYVSRQRSSSRQRQTIAEQNIAGNRTPCLTTTSRAGQR